MTVPAINAIAAPGAVDPAMAMAPAIAPRATPAATFAGLLVDGVESVNKQLLTADAVTKAFALDDSIPLHQVTFALEQARLSFELLLQVRTKLVESYQEFSRMQL